MQRHHIRFGLKAVSQYWELMERNRFCPTGVVGKLTTELLPLEVTITQPNYTVITAFNDYPYVEVEMWAGGGAGGFVGPEPISGSAAAGGGGGGAYGRWILPRSFWADRLYAFAGSGGIADSNQAETGLGSLVSNGLYAGSGVVFVPGGSSGIQDLGEPDFIAHGGPGGQTYTAQNAPQPVVFIAGSDGMDGVRNPLLGGRGGDAGNRPDSGGLGGQNAIGHNGQVPGGGGGGASRLSNGSALKGGNGANGLVIIRWPGVDQ